MENVHKTLFFSRPPEKRWKKTLRRERVLCEQRTHISSSSSETSSSSQRIGAVKQRARFPRRERVVRRGRRKRRKRTRWCRPSFFRATFLWQLWDFCPPGFMAAFNKRNRLVTTHNKRNGFNKTVMTLMRSNGALTPSKRRAGSKRERGYARRREEKRRRPRTTNGSHSTRFCLRGKKDLSGETQSFEGGW